MVIEIRFLYWDDCQSHDDALARLRRCIDNEGVEADLQIIRVQTLEEAVKFRFVGSPTILVNGDDIDPPKTSHYALTCRGYSLEDGRISPLPPESLILKALRKAKAKKS